MSVDYICGKHHRVGCGNLDCAMAYCKEHSPVCLCVECVVARKLFREQVRSAVNPKCTKYSDDTQWCACDNCVTTRGKVRIVNPDGSETLHSINALRSHLSYENMSRWKQCPPLTPHGEKLRILDRMHEATLAWLLLKIEAKDWGAVIRIATSLAEIDAERKA